VSVALHTWRRLGLCRPKPPVRPKPPRTSELAPCHPAAGRHLPGRVCPDSAVVQHWCLVMAQGRRRDADGSRFPVQAPPPSRPTGLQGQQVFRASRSSGP